MKSRKSRLQFMEKKSVKTTILYLEGIINKSERQRTNIETSGTMVN